jgi:hypothetical protein
MQDDDDYIILWEAPKIIPPEFRLYYSDTGKVICYTCEKLDGNYIIIDASIYAAGRPDVRVIDGKISNLSECVVVTKLMPDAITGQSCVTEDISIVVGAGYVGDTIKWKLNTYELRN